MGETESSLGVRPLAALFTQDQKEILDGAIDAAGQVLGTYVHGFFDNDSFRHSFLDWARSSLNLASAGEGPFVTAERAARLNRWADHLRSSLRLDLIRSWVVPRPEMAARYRRSLLGSLITHCDQQHKADRSTQHAPVAQGLPASPSRLVPDRATRKIHPRARDKDRLPTVRPAEFSTGS